MATPDNVCEKYAARKVKITVRTLPGDANTFLVEGDRAGLEFLGELFLAQARADDCGFHIEPKGPGSTFFTRASTAGIYVHRLHKPSSSKNGRGNGKTKKRLAKA